MDWDKEIANRHKAHFIGYCIERIVKIAAFSIFVWFFIFAGASK